MRRRDFLAGTAGLAGGGLATSGLARPGVALAQALAPPPRPAVYLVPGYRPDRAHYRGRPLGDDPAFRRFIPKNYREGATLLTRVDEADGSVRRALLPITGHKVTLRPGGGLAVWASNNFGTLLTLDPDSLEPGTITGYHGADFVGGGHAVFTPDGGQVVVSERRLSESYSGDPARHFGQLTVRDPATLRVLEAYGCHGIAPHEVALLADGRHLAVANYGSYSAANDWRPQIAEPCLTVIELASGKLVDKRIIAGEPVELRHLAAHSLDRLFGIRVRRGSGEEEAALLNGVAEVYEPDGSSFDDGRYLPAPVEKFLPAAEGGGSVTALPDDPLMSRHGQSLLYDPEHDEVVTAFTSSNAIGVVDGASGGLKRAFRTDRLGLRYPRGVALHPDGLHYAVSGSWQGIFLFRRGLHSLSAERTIHETFFDHSHLTVA